MRATFALAERAAAEMKEQGRFNLGGGSARPGGLRSAVRQSPRRVSRPRKQDVKTPREAVSGCDSSQPKTSSDIARRHRSIRLFGSRRGE